PRGVGGADDPVLAPRDHEEHRLLGLGDEAALRTDPVARDDQVDTLRRVDLEGTLAAHHFLDLVGPDTGRVDDRAGADGEVDTVLQVASLDADDPLTLAEEAGHLRT